MNDMNIHFWQPTNAVGTAATLDSTYKGKPVKINFYWSGMELAAEPKSKKELLDQIREFESKHPLTDPKGKNVFYVRRELDEFYETSDPGWVSPAQKS